MPPSRKELEKSARRAVSEVRDPRKAAGLVAAGAAGAAAAAGIGIRRFRASDDAGEFDSDAYRLLPGEPVAAGLKRALAVQVDDAISQLRGEAGSEPAEAVHEARKDVKKIRSALRLVRAEIGDDVWGRENDHYREIARGLSGFRDAEILVVALDGVTERFRTDGENPSAALREQLENENREAQSDGSLETAMVDAASALVAGRARIDALPLEGDGWELIGPGLHRTYRRGRKQLRTVQEEASVASLHELRKRVKDLWYQVRLIRDADKHMLGALADHAHDLSDHLGDDHDLALLRETVQRRRVAFADPAEKRHLIEQIDQRRGELQFAAISLAERIYSDKPKRFSKRLEKRWEAWRDRTPVEA
jgi:CHAD domain-containing protein